MAWRQVLTDLYYCTGTIANQEANHGDGSFIVLIPGLLGGFLLSLLIARFRRGTPPTFVPRRLEAPSPSLINMAHIKVEGLGGLGIGRRGDRGRDCGSAHPSRGDYRVRAWSRARARPHRDEAIERGMHSGDGPDDQSMLHLGDERRSRESKGQSTTFTVALHW